MQTEKRDRADLPDPTEMERAAQRLREIHSLKSGEDWTKSRSLTEAQWEEIRGIIEQFRFPCDLGHTPYGFVLIVHNHAPISGTDLDQLLCVEDGEFPFPSVSNGFDGQLETLQTLSPITHNPRNAEILAWYGFEPLNPRLESYTY